MEKICVFCGRSLGRWEKKSLYCGNGTQTVCKDCYEKYSPMTNVERGLLAWETGRAESREELREFVEQVKRTREEKQEKEREDREQKRTGKGRILHSRAEVMGEFCPTAERIQSFWENPA